MSIAYDGAPTLGNPSIPIKKYLLNTSDLPCSFYFGKQHFK